MSNEATNVDQINTGRCAFIVKPQTTRIQIINLSDCNQKRFELGCFFPAGLTPLRASSVLTDLQPSFISEGSVHDTCNARRVHFLSLTDQDNHTEQDQLKKQTNLKTAKNQNKKTPTPLSSS